MFLMFVSKLLRIVVYKKSGRSPSFARVGSGVFDHVLPCFVLGLRFALRNFYVSEICKRLVRSVLYRNYFYFVNAQY